MIVPDGRLALAAYADDDLAALYDLVYDAFDDDVPFYREFARRAEGPVLELCAGSGRVTVPLAQEGVELVAVDASPPMLDRLRSRLDEATTPRVRLIEADMRNFDLGQRFELAFCAFGSFEQLLTKDDQLACLRTVASHLAPGGVFVAELRSLTAIDWDVEPQLMHEWTRPDPATGGQISKLRSVATSRERQVTIDTVIFDRSAVDGTVRRRILEVPMRAIGRFELELLLERADLRLAALYGDTTLSPYTDQSDSMIFVAELQG
jgi:SAM-dependent methyltransferase